MRTAPALIAALLIAGCVSLRAPPPAAPPSSQEPPGTPPSPQAPLSAPGSLPPQEPAARASGVAIADLAASLVGTPYHFGGADASGFDCSGLVLYVHERLGLLVPRSAAEQHRAAHRVSLARLLPGDLVFFHIRSRGVDHVGIYAGDGRFIHAPHAGLAVSYGDLSRGFYARHLVSAGRFWDQAT
jgi:murein DD-endopeptidase